MAEPTRYIHGNKLTRKAKSNSDLLVALEYYNQWKLKSLAVQNRNEQDVRKLTDYLNEYKQQVEPIFDSRKNSAQEVLQPSILEEFISYLFCNLDDQFNMKFYRDMGSSFYDMIIHPCSLKSMSSKPEFTMRKKDQDFVIGFQGGISLKIDSCELIQEQKILIPAVAIECKRYLERNMLDECSGTADKIKSATPYCKFYVVAEYLKMDDASPKKTRIDEIYILRHQKNSDRLKEDFQPNHVDWRLVWDLYSNVFEHLSSIWWDKNSGLSIGKVFNF